MKKILLLFISLIMLGMGSCSDNAEKVPDPIDGENKYITGEDLSKSFSLRSNYEVVHGLFNVLGYGYDVTGKYAHPAYIKAEIIDAEKCEAENYYEVYRRNIFTHGGSGTILGMKHEMINRYSALMNISEDEVAKYPNILKDMFNLPFENDSSFKDLDYYYANNSFVSAWYTMFFDNWERNKEDVFLKYLTDEFKKDITVMSGEDIIKKYGTHILAAITVGQREDFLYRSSSNNELEKRMLYRSAAVFGKVPGMWMTPAPKSYLEKENIYYEMVGTKAPKKNAWMVDLTNYKGEIIPTGQFEDMEENEVVLVDFMDSSWQPSLIPVYEVIKDEAKKKEVQEAFDNYLSK